MRLTETALATQSGATEQRIRRLVDLGILEGAGLGPAEHFSQPPIASVDLTGYTALTEDEGDITAAHRSSEREGQPPGKAGP